MEIIPPLTFVGAMFRSSTDKFTTKTTRFWFCIVFARLVVVVDRKSALHVLILFSKNENILIRLQYIVMVWFRCGWRIYDSKVIKDESSPVCTVQH